MTDEKTHQQTAEKINSLATNYPNNHYIVTCRIAGWKNLLPSFNVLETQDFSRAEIQQFIFGWHRAIITKSEENKLKLQFPDEKSFQRQWQVHLDKVVAPAIDLQSKKLISAIDENSRILAIAVNPMLLSLISLVHLNRSILPKGRTLLYAQCIEFLIDAWDRSRDITSTLEITYQQKENVLREIAFNFQTQGKGEQQRDALEKLIATILPNLGIAKPADSFLLDIEQRSGLLIERSIDVLGFSHLTLQEYLAAKYIHLNPEHVHYLYENLDTQEWREVILLYIGMLDDASDFIRHILQVNSIQRLILVGYCVGDAMKVDPVVSQAVVDELWEGLIEEQQYIESRLNALAAIATDYESNAVTVEQRLAEKIVLSIASTDPILAAYAVEIAGKARLTCALPLLIHQLSNPQQDVLIEPINKAFIAYGNLALPPIRQLIDNLTDKESAVITRIISIILRINTTLAAKFLIKLYGYFFSGDLHLFILNGSPFAREISYSISQLLNNPFIEADLTNLRMNDLPEAIKKKDIDNNGWWYPDCSQAFRLLDQQIRTDLDFLIAHNVNEVAFDDVAFKQLFPVILNRIRQVDLTPDFIQKVGFDTSEGKLEKILYLAKQIKSNSAQTLAYALLQRPNDDSEDNTTHDSWKRKFGLWVCNIGFILFVIWDLFWSYGLFDEQFKSRIPYLFNWRFMIGYQFKFAFLCFIVVLGKYLYIYIFTYIKQQRELSLSFVINWLFMPISNTLRVLPYTVGFKTWIKWIFMMLLLTVFSGPNGVLLDKFLSRDSFPNDGMTIAALTFGSMITIVILSTLYLKLYVLKSNPINQLRRLHKRGKANS